MGTGISHFWALGFKGFVALAAISSTIAICRAETGISGDDIVFGQSAAFDGPAASLGTAFRHSLLAAFEEANRSGGVAGRSLKLLSYDDGYEPETGDHKHAQTD